MTKDERINKFKWFMGSYCNEGMIQKLDNMGFFTAPASTKYHGDYEGGLFDHSYNVASILVQLTHDNRLQWLDDRSPYIVGMFHDLCKCDQYIKSNPLSHDDANYRYNPDTTLKGHGDKSVILLSQFYRLNFEEILAIRYHMGAFTDKAEWSDFTRAVETAPNVLWTHHADMIATHVME